MCRVVRNVETLKTSRVVEINGRGHFECFLEFEHGEILQKNKGFEICALSKVIWNFLGN